MTLPLVPPSIMGVQYPKRFYFQNAAPSLTPSLIRGAWTASPSVSARKLGAVKAGAAFGVGHNDLDVEAIFVYGRSFVSEPLLDAYTFSGSLSLVLGAQASTSADTGFGWHIWLTQGETSNLRATLASAGGVAGDLITTSAAGRAFNISVSGSGQIGDRLVFEMGVFFNNRFGAMNATIWYGNTGATDLTNGSANVTTQPGWVEFPNVVPLP